MAYEKIGHHFQDAGRVERYFKSPAINNSLLSKCFTPKWLMFAIDNTEMETVDRRVFRIGSAIDTLMTEPERFHEQFYIFSESKPTSMMGVFIDALAIDVLIEEPTPMQAVMIDAAYSEAYKTSGYKKQFKAVKDAFLSDPKALSYHRARMNAKGKTIISTDEFEEVNTCINAIKSVGVISEFFKRDRGEHMETILQADVYWEKDGLRFKALLDGITINHETKRIMPFDLKSTSAVISEFSESFWKWGYARQAAHYITGLIHNEHFAKLLSNGYIIGYDDDTAFKFIVSPKSERQAEGAVIYNMSWNCCDIGLWSGEAFFGGKKHYFRGINELIEAYKWHMSTRNFTAPMWIVSKNYELQIEH